MPFSSVSRINSTSLMAGMAADLPLRRSPSQGAPMADDDESVSAAEGRADVEQSASTSVGGGDTPAVRSSRSYVGVTHGKTLSHVIAAYRDF